MPFVEYNTETFQLKGADEKPILGDITYANSYPDYIIVFVHGFKGFKDWGAHHLMANYFASKGIYFAKFNFSHSGVSPENLTDISDLELFARNTPSKELFDLDEVISFISTKFPHLKIVLLGHSRGGALSILQAAKDSRVSKLITWAAIADFNNLWKPEDVDEWRAKGIRYITNARTQKQMPLSVKLLEDVEQNADLFDISKAASSLNKSWLITQGTNDLAVETQVAQTFHQLQSQSELLIIEDANHVYGAQHPFDGENMPTDMQIFVEACINFLSQ